MPSTYSTSLKLQLIGTGEQAGVWGTTTNYNLGTLLEQAITGVVTIPMGDANYTMTNYNGLSDEARNAVLVLNGPITSPQNLIAPSGQQKVYVVRNFTGNTVTIRTATGNGVALTNAASAVVFTDGTDFYSATTLNYIDGNLTVTGTTTLGGTLTANSTVILKSDVFANTNKGQWYLPTGNTSQRTSSPINGLIRYNTDTNGTTPGFYEGYTNGQWVKFLTANQDNYIMTYVVVGGGGGGSYPGGGAGKFTASTTTLFPNVTYTFTVGAGGAAGSTGGTSEIVGIASSPGGLGNGTSGNGYPPGSTTGTDGGGGGGGSSGNGGQGYNSGGDFGIGGTGGAGTATLITGSSLTLAGGGGGGGYYAGGVGTAGGGNGGNGRPGGGDSPPGSPGAVNTGSGGGGAGLNTVGPAGGGGSGKIIISVPTTSYSGITTGSPTIFTSGSNTVLVYNSSGTYTA